jgi:hypothetical protein
MNGDEKTILNRNFSVKGKLVGIQGRKAKGPRTGSQLPLRNKNIPKRWKK